MYKNKVQLSCFFVLFLFLTIIFLDWLFSFFIQQEPEIGITSWFVVFPLMSFFYFAFAIIAIIGLFFRNRLGLMLAYCVILFGIISASLSYLFVFRSPGYGTAYLILVVFNVCILIYMAFSSCYFTGD